jgi:hypothetical protein
MDYRHTEDFARMMEAAELRAQYLRSQAHLEFGRALLAALRAGWHRIAARARRTPIVPEA